ncbi:hypothetical protein E4U30_000322, partial [Claviceps sp. LM220 group G6]
MHPEAIRAETVHYASAIPPYPISSDKGYAYVIDTTRIDEADVKEPWNAIQYCRARRGDPSSTDSAFFSDEPVKVHHYKCTGIKQCEHLDDALKAPHYDANDHPYWKDLERISARYREPNNLQTAAVAWIWQRLHDVLNDKACSKSDGPQQLSPCKLELKRSLALTPGGHYQWFLRCSNIPDEMDFGSWGGHRSVVIPEQYGNNEDVRKIFREILNDPKAHRHTNRGPGCSCVDRTIRSKPTCDETHMIGGKGKMESIKCDVKFSIIIPAKRAKKSPYIIFVSHGKHSHAPPPQTSIPRALRIKLDESIRNALTETYHTTGSKKTWLRSHAMKVFLEEHNARTLSEVHPAFSNDDRLNYFIAKHKGIHQNGYRGREAVRFEWLTYHQDSPDTASFYDDGEDFLAVCFTKGMAKLWKDCKTFQFDMNFKRVNGKKDHEVIFAQRIDEKFG